MRRAGGGCEMLDSSYIKLGLSGFAKGWMWSVKERDIKNDSKSSGLSSWKGEMSLTKVQFISFSAGRSQDGRGIGRGDHFLSYKFIERTIERRTKFTKQLLIASSGHQVPRKAAHCLRREYVI